MANIENEYHTELLLIHSLIANIIFTVNLYSNEGGNLYHGYGGDMDHGMTGDYMAHDFCFMWDPWLVWLLVPSDVLTGIACISISPAI